MWGGEGGWFGVGWLEEVVGWWVIDRGLMDGE